MDIKIIRVVRTPSSERFLLQKELGRDAAAVDLHYLANGSVAGTVFLFDDGGISDPEVPALLQYFDESLLPDVSLDRQNLTFTVVRGRVVGSFAPDAAQPTVRP